MQLEFKINKPLEVVFDHLTDMKKFVSIHPIISRMDELGGNKYKVRETLKMGGVPVSFTYPAWVESNKEKRTVNMKATVMGFVKVEMNYHLSAEGNRTWLKEEVTYRNAGFLRPRMESIFREQHEQMFRNLDALS